MSRSAGDEKRIAWLRLARTETVGPVTFAQLVGRFGSAVGALRALPDLARRGGRAEAPSIPTIAQAEAEVAAGEAIGARLITGFDPEFPRLLAVLDAPPPLLWVLGNPALLHRPCVAIVGARVASSAGRRFARNLASALGEAGWVVVSGMARGVDAAAHQGAMPFGTVAVLAGAVTEAYPPENSDLHLMLRNEGCIVSDRAMGHQARAADFPRRNRIISGLSRGVVVVEAELRSGSLITARLAAEQGREVFAVPGSPLDPRSRGANDLIRQGATLVENAEDILRVLDSLPGLEEPEAPSFDLTGSDPGVEGLAQTLEALLSPTPATYDDLARAAEAPVSAVLAALVELSLAGRAELLPGGMAVCA